MSAEQSLTYEEGRGVIFFGHTRRILARNQYQHD